MTSHERDRLREALDYAIEKRDEEDQHRFGHFRSTQFAAWKQIRAQWDVIVADRTDRSQAR